MSEPVKYPFTFAGVSQNTPAWGLKNGGELLRRGPEQIENVPHDGVPGRLGRRHVRDELTVQLEYWFDGNVSPAGVPYANPVAGLETNQDLWMEQVYDALRDEFGCIEAVGVKPNGATATGGIQLSEPRFSDGYTDSTMFVQCTIPSGALVVEG